MDVMNTVKRLLILSCSQRKRPDPGLLPAIERYDGPVFQVVRRYLREQPAGSKQLDVFILSARYGLIPLAGHEQILPPNLTPVIAQGSSGRRQVELRDWLYSGLPKSSSTGSPTPFTGPACQQFGAEGLQISGMNGFCNRATHNLWTLLDEARQIDEHLAAGTYHTWYEQHARNSTYRPLIDHALSLR